MTGAPDAFPDWDWQDPGRLEATMERFTAELAAAEKLEQVAAELPRSRAELAELGVTGIEFAAFTTEHPQGLGTDLVAMRGPEDEDGRRIVTEPGPVYRVNGRSLFTQLDITEPLPFEDGSVDWVYAEHLIEHVPLLDAINWLAEVRRILAPGGLLRITTPDLRAYAAGYLTEGEKFFARHRRRLSVMRVGPPMPERRAFMVNQIFYLYGHRWIYDHDELRYALTQAGYDPGHITARKFRDGQRQDVADLDTTFRSDETIYVEAMIA
ncbi:MAG TPA: methyltransferase domain-containing protein [Streptosporangiaceae bacterium]